MKISVLQSLIDRTSNEIAEYEECIKIYKLGSLQSTTEWELDQYKLSISYYKQRLPKLRKIQKDLKKEIAKEVKKAALQRFYDSM